MTGFKHPLFSCCEDLKGITLANCAPCIIHGDIGEYIDRDWFAWTTLYAFCWCFAGSYTRWAVRKKKELEGNVWEDIAISWFCSCCALVQEKREFETNPAEINIKRYFPST